MVYEIISTALGSFSSPIYPKQPMALFFTTFKKHVKFLEFTFSYPIKSMHNGIFTCMKNIKNQPFIVDKSTVRFMDPRGNCIGSSFFHGNLR